MSAYRVLNKQVFTSSPYSLVPIRMQDRYDIMKWRNEQIYHLRQNKPLTEKDQDDYFQNVVAKLFDMEQPNQLLFSYLEGDKCIGYGGLVHINWVDRNAEVSFVMDTKLEKEGFEFHWQTYLSLLEEVAFKDLNFHKIFTYAFDLRPKLYSALKGAGFVKEATLIDHCFFEGEFKNVLIHSKINHPKITYRPAVLGDAKILYEWANDVDVRMNSLNSQPIDWDDHIHWLKKKLNEDSSEIFIFFKGEIPIGQVRLDFEKPNWTIDFSVDKNHRGKGIGKRMLEKIIQETSFKPLHAIVKEENVSSSITFNSLDFAFLGKKVIAQSNVFEFLKK